MEQYQVIHGQVEVRVMEPLHLKDGVLLIKIMIIMMTTMKMIKKRKKRKKKMIVIKMNHQVMKMMIKRKKKEKMLKRAIETTMAITKMSDANETSPIVSAFFIYCLVKV